MAPERMGLNPQPCESILNWSQHGAQRVIQLWINEHHTQKAMLAILKDILYMTPNYRFKKKPTDSNRSMYLTISQSMASYDFFYKSTI